jgi:predicted lipoprotein with Yx(FWY)xxD motif
MASDLVEGQHPTKEVIMRRVRIAGIGAVAAVALVALVVAVAAGTGGGGSDSTNATDADASGTGNTTVSAEELGDAGRVLVDSEGQALYASEQEAGGRVMCTDDACLSFWEPLTIKGGTPSGSSIGGMLGLIDRPDGTKQVTYKGMPLYSFSEDQPGEVNGDGFEDAFDGQQFTWNVVSVGGGAGRSDQRSASSSDSGTFSY